jgi:hypothetical protein
MLDVEPVIREELARLEAGRHSRPDWSDVLARSEPVARSRGRLVLVAAVVVTALVVVAVAIAASFGGFSTWLNGEPGKPASTAAQLAFARATRFWAGFPSGTQLRQLVQTTSSGQTFTLYGFRGAGALCLRLDVSGDSAATQLVCPPLSQLRTSSEPALAAAVDEPIGTGERVRNGPFDFTLPKATVTFGIVADAVTKVEVAHSSRSTSNAVLSGDAFLSIDPHPSATEYVTGIRAGSANVLARIPYSPRGVATTALGGPTRVQRVLRSGTIRWFAHREPRGAPVPRNLHHIVGTTPSVIFAREITPNPSAPERLVVSISPAGKQYFGGRLRNDRKVCVDVVGGRYPDGGGCWPAGRLFSTGPIALGFGAQASSSQYVTFAGLASDDVARLELFPTSGPAIPVPLHDNGFLVEASLSDYPLNLVAYTNTGLVIGTTAIRGSTPPPIPANATPQVRATTWKPIIRNNAGQVWLGPSLAGTSCAIIERPRSPGPPQICQPIVTLEPKAIGTVVVHGPSPTVAVLTVGSAIARVTLHLIPSGPVTATTERGYVLAAVPSNSRIDSITAFNANGQVVTTQHLTGQLVGGAGTITRLTSTSLVLANGHVTCRLTNSSPPTDAYRTDDYVQYLCQNGVLQLIGHATRDTPTMRAQGPIVTLTPSALTTRNELTKGTPLVTCQLTEASPATRLYKQGEQIQIFCSRGALTGINQTR